MLKWLKTGASLPEPVSPCFAGANTDVKEALSSGKRENNKYTPEQLAEMQKPMETQGQLATSVKSITWLVSAIRRRKTVLIKHLKFVDIDKIESLPPSALGKDLEDEVQKYIVALRSSGSIVNLSIAMSPIWGIVLHSNKYLLREFGGSLEITKHLAYSLLKRFVLEKRMGTKAACKLPTNLNVVAAELHHRISKCVKQHKIPPSLIIDWDQTGIKLIPVSEWTMSITGSKQGEITGLDDKPIITGLLACSMDGSVLSPKLIYGGKTLSTLHTFLHVEL